MQLLSLLTATSLLILPAWHQDPPSDSPDDPTVETVAPQDVPRTDLIPLMERYLLDELKQLRVEVHQARRDMIAEITQRELNVVDRALTYSSNTVTYFFYIVIGTAAIMAFLGWQSMRDLKRTLKLSADHEIERLSREYQQRFSKLEAELQEKGKIIELNHQAIEKTQQIHSLWLQSHQASTPRTKIEIYDQILELEPDDPEVLAYKADAAIELGEFDWALNLCNSVLDQNPEHAMGLYQRACCHAGLGMLDEAMQDLEQAVQQSFSLREHARTDEMLANLHGREDYRALVGNDTQSSGASDPQST